MVYVKTVYDEKSFRLPNVTGYKTKENADMFIETCKEWGIGIVSCEIIDNAEALSLIKENKVDHDEDQLLKKQFDSEHCSHFRMTTVQVSQMAYLTLTLQED